MNSPVPTSVARSIHPATTLGPVTLRVADVSRSTQFYTEALGFQAVSDVAGLLALGVMSDQGAAAGSPLVLLKDTPGAVPARHASGLFHFAILVPSRPALGRALRMLAKAELSIGEADHLVSEALYLSDPDGNGIEIYRDRPRDQWKWNNGTVQMATEPLDLEDLLREAESEPAARISCPGYAHRARPPAGLRRAEGRAVLQRHPRL